MYTNVYHSSKKQTEKRISAKKKVVYMRFTHITTISVIIIFSLNFSGIIQGVFKGAFLVLEKIPKNHFSEDTEPYCLSGIGSSRIRCGVLLPFRLICF